MANYGGSGPRRNTNTWIIVAIVAVLVVLAIWWYATPANTPTDAPAEAPAAGTNTTTPAAPAAPAQ
jgi:hypothetical protein